MCIIKTLKLVDHFIYTNENVHELLEIIDSSSEGYLYAIWRREKFIILMSGARDWVLNYILE